MKDETKKPVKNEIILEMMRIIRERYRMAFDCWVMNNNDMAIVALKAVIKDTTSLIEYLEKNKHT